MGRCRDRWMDGFERGGREGGVDIQRWVGRSR